MHHDVSYSATPDVLELEGDGSGLILLPHFPLVAVTSIEVGTTELSTDAEVDFRPLKAQGMIRRLGAFWPRGALITITYTHGFDCTVTPATGSPGDDDYVPEAIAGLPEDIQGAVLGMAEVLLVTDAGVQSKTVLGDTVTFGAAATVGETQAWSDAVSNYALRAGA